MKAKTLGKFIKWSVPLLLIVPLVSLKLALSVGRVLQQFNEIPEAALVSQVHAADRAAQPKQPLSPAPLDPPGETQPAPAATQPYTASIPDVMAHIQQRELELKQKEKLLQEREEYLKRMQEDVERQLKELIDVQKEIQAYRTEKEENRSAQIRSLSKIYGTMKPKEAAKLLENLEDQLVVSIISSMNATEAANILANMDIKKAAKISQSLSQSR
ncbi:MotE family protein [Desulfoferrobacter suflitae]|uniref:MotE family protein n=1 Tax=Desulfoferrobacter suflitae TaxID=2865782 RepID=UPI00216433B2|nr:hypothetical protein [Desulfoferrobacter suflitae]MCK8602437.1 hypothetical protein [Desulfoferrobacter suflitae]